MAIVWSAEWARAGTANVRIVRGILKLGDQRIFAAILDVNDTVDGFFFVVSFVSVLLDCMLVLSAMQE